jgi:hypothetical protein
MNPCSGARWNKHCNVESIASFSCFHSSHILPIEAKDSEEGGSF